MKRTKLGITVSCLVLFGVLSFYTYQETRTPQIVSSQASEPHYLPTPPIVDTTDPIEENPHDSVGYHELQHSAAAIAEGPTDTLVASAAVDSNHELLPTHPVQQGTHDIQAYQALEYIEILPACTQLGDLDCSQEVNLLDLSTLLSQFGFTISSSDIDTSGEVNVLDLSILLSNYGTQ